MDHNLMEVLLPIGILGTLAAGLILFTKSLTDYFLKKRMVDKGIVGNDAADLLKTQEGSKFSSLKWGLIILFGGLGLVIIDVVSIPDAPASALTYGIFAISISLGFLIYYFMVKRLTQDHS